MTDPAPDLRAVGRAFGLPGRFVSGGRLGRGHIHATFAATYDHEGRPVRWVHQRLNATVFRRPEVVVENAVRVVEHLHRKLAPLGNEEAARRALTVVPAADGRPYAVDAAGDWWRTWAFIEGARTIETVTTPEEAREAARTFATFQRLLADLPPPPLAETIPGFHDTPARLAALDRAVAADPLNRASSIREELRLVETHRDLAERLEALRAAGTIAERTVHNDTKVSNLLFDARTDEGLCVLDLDTVMPGIALHDFGDLARSAVASTPEDDPRAERLEVREEIFAALALGWVEGLAGLADPAETPHLVTATRVIALELATRFLVDHLEGDRTFRAERERHNVDRARVQLALVRELGAREDALLRRLATLR